LLGFLYEFHRWLGVNGLINLSRHKKLIALIVVGILIFIVWFCWMSMVTAKTNWMTNKVAGNLELGIQIIERDAPRIKVTNDGGYYEPDVNMNAILPGNTPANRQSTYTRIW
jgi:hypothetical protein